jgi:hypothetical protein
MSSLKLNMEILRNCGDGQDRVVTKNIRNKLLYLKAARRQKLRVGVRWRHLWQFVEGYQVYFDGYESAFRSAKCGLQLIV